MEMMDLNKIWFCSPNLIPFLEIHIQLVDVNVLKNEKCPLGESVS